MDGFVQQWQKSARSKSNKNKVGELYAVKSENLIFKGGCDGHEATAFYRESFYNVPEGAMPTDPSEGK